MRKLFRLLALAALTAVPVVAAVPPGATPPAAPPSTAPTTAPTTRPTALVLPDVDGKPRRPADVDGYKAAVVFFLAHDCPISNGYAPEVNRICAAYGGPGKLSFAIVHPYEELTADEARKHAKDFGYTAPVFVDTQRSAVKAMGPKVTPEAVVVAADGRVVYRGRIDDRWVDYGKGRAEPTVRDLRNALDAVLADKPVPGPTGEAVGCPIE